MNILERIIAHKKQEVANRKKSVSAAELEQLPLFQNERVSAVAWLTDPQKSGVIAEFKRKSPSKGLINGMANPAEVAQGYEAAGASAMSVLTDNEFFGGNTEDLIAARKVSSLPLLRKDFIIDEYQLLEARAMGADLVLLIAANLAAGQLQTLAQTAHSLQLQTLLEVHDEAELNSHYNPHIDIVGVNNRNLKTFEVSLDTSRQLADRIPSESLKISESGIHSIDDMLDLREHGYNGFLIGENFMKTEQPGEAAKVFIGQYLEKVEE